MSPEEHTTIRAPASNEQATFFRLLRKRLAANLAVQDVLARLSQEILLNSVASYGPVIDCEPAPQRLALIRPRSPAFLLYSLPDRPGEAG